MSAAAEVPGACPIGSVSWRTFPTVELGREPVEQSKALPLGRSWRTLISPVLPFLNYIQRPAEDEQLMRVFSSFESVQFVGKSAQTFASKNMAVAVIVTM